MPSLEDECAALIEEARSAAAEAGSRWVWYLSELNDEASSGSIRLPGVDGEIRVGASPHPTKKAATATKSKKSVVVDFLSIRPRGTCSIVVGNQHRHFAIVEELGGVRAKDKTLRRDFEKRLATVLWSHVDSGCSACETALSAFQLFVLSSVINTGHVSEEDGQFVIRNVWAAVLYSLGNPLRAAVESQQSTHCDADSSAESGTRGRPRLDAAEISRRNDLLNRVGTLNPKTAALNLAKQEQADGDKRELSVIVSEIHKDIRKSQDFFRKNPKLRRRKQSRSQK